MSTLGSKTLADSFILVLNTLTWHRISQENDAFDKDSHKTETNFNFLNKLSQDTLEGKSSKSHVNLEVSPFLS